MSNIATMSVRLLADTRRFSAGMLKAQTEMGFTIRNAGRLQEKMGKVGLTAGVVARGFHVMSGLVRAAGIAAAVAGAAFVGFGAITSKVARDFEDQFKKVQSITYGTAEAMESLRESTFKQGISMGISPTEMMKGAVEAARTGLSTGQVEAINPDIINLARIEMVDFKTAAELGTNVMKAFRMEVKAMDESGGALDSISAVQQGFEKTGNILATAAATSNTNIRRLNDGLKKMASNANAANVPLSQAAAAMGFLGDVGFVGEEGGTALRNILTRATKETGKIKKIMKETNLEMSKMGRSKDLINIVKEIEKANISPANLQEIFGLRAQPAMLALLERGSEALQLYTDFLEESKGMTEQFEIQQQTTAVKIARLKAVIEVAAIAIGQGFNVAIGTAADYLVDLWDRSGMTTGQLQDMTQNGLLWVVKGFGKFLRMVPPVLSAVGGLIDAFRLIGKTLKFLVSFSIESLHTMAKTMARIFQGIGTLIGGIWDTLTSRIKTLGSAITTLLSDASAGDKMAALGDIFNLKQGAEDMKSSIKNALDESSVYFKSAFEEWKAGFEKVIWNNDGLLAKFTESMNREELLQVSTFFDKIGEGFTDAANEVDTFAALLEKAFNDPKNKINEEYLKMIEEMRRKLAELRGTYTGENHINTSDDGKEKKRKRDRLEHLNLWRLRAEEIVAVNDDRQLKLKAHLELLADIQDIGRRNLSVEDRGLLMAKARNDYEDKLLKIKNDRANTDRRSLAVAEEETRLAHERHELAKKEARMDQVKGLMAGVGMLGGAGVSDSLQKQLAEAQRQADYAAMDAGQDKRNAAISHQNDLIIEQISLYEQLADTISSQVPSMVASVSSLTAENFKSAEGTEAMLSSMQAASQLGTTAISALVSGTKNQRRAQMALNLAMAAMATGLAIFAAVTPGMQGQAAGYGAAAVAFASKAALSAGGGAAGRGLRTTSKAPDTEEAAAESTRRGVLDALKEAGLYQPWENLTLNTFGTTPVGYGGSNLSSARDVEYGRQIMNRSRG